ncbi:uncharacterized mitochondrial protein AtMg00810-like [Macadamia integrifolia]|uniref:uncharacterized mitochondrial protein AtMg00810-like n=1 Tax=Macadamia integrifolia TaxID=60698 RepID=UPI001C4E8871|nr:uncharacterized mitochondrial protein AtMg00810-like [Macadamia integrifolia]
MDDCKPVQTPMATTASSSSGGALMTDPTPYWSIVGALYYATLMRPDIAFYVNCACQHMHEPTEEHWALVKRILHYMKHTRFHGLLLERSPNVTLQAFSDADWVGSSLDRHSTGDFAIFLGPNLIS